MDAEVCARRLPRIIEFIGYEPDPDRYDVAAVIEHVPEEALFQPLKEDPPCTIV